MEFIQILESEIEPGGLVEWVPAAAGGLGSWLRDPRGTSHNHEQHLRSAHEHLRRTRREGGRESWLGVSVEFDEQISLTLVDKAIRAYIDRHEVLRTHVVLHPDGRTQRYTTGPGSVHLRHTRIGWYGDATLLLEQIAGAVDRATAPVYWPAYRFATVARAGSFTLLFAADHSLVDGYSLVHAQHEFRELYAAAREQRPPQLPPTGSYLDFSGAERSVADASDERHTAVAVWRGFLAECGGALPRFAPLPPAPPRLDDDPPAQAARTALLLDDAATEAFTRRCTDRDGSLTGGLLAVAAQVYRRRSGAGLFATVMPRHTRNKAVFHTALGWFVGLAPVAVAIDDDPDFPTALDRAMASLDRAREGAALPLLRLAEIIGFDPAPSFVVSFMDTRGVPGAQTADAGGARALRSHSYSDDEVYIWINRTPSGLRIHARYPAEEDRVSILLSYLDDFAARLAELATHE
ncbi:MAG: condensation domain-containing protein [Gordonia sp. (in: high G+C Gram-positive bacteria)]|uniref:condensation domain-containing protein n=1 Tax=Gordonia sp. (in: high G+C Gram-positive bacteria) TaxID=84139 RepID=UPI0039E62D96